MPLCIKNYVRLQFPRTIKPKETHIAPTVPSHTHRDSHPTKYLQKEKTTRNIGYS